MNFITVFYTALFVVVSFLSPHKKEIAPKKYAKISRVNKVTSVYNSLETNNFKLPNLESFSRAFEGYQLLKSKGMIKKDILTIIDFSLSSKEKRLWIIDMNTHEILLNTLVAHGKNSGDDYASKFSNKNESYRSSLGFFSTGEVYRGKHGLSLKLDGLEKGINDNARKRAVVIHGADYVSKTFIRNHKRLGRSQGCPAVPVELSKKIIQTIKNKSCLFIYHPSRSYVNNSKLIS
ncbi:murein L,D-transpeptidase catalytic domain family protein [Flavobacterium koreense]